MNFAHSRAGHFSLWLSGVLLSLCFSVHAAPETGWWWNPQQSGRGFFLEMQGPNMFLGGYLYQEDGHATWLVSNAPMPEVDSYDGRLLSFGNGQSLVGEYRAPSPSVDMGAISLRFSDESHATLTWPGGTIPIERYRFRSGQDATFRPRTGWWWNPAESGRGFSIEIQGNHLFAVGYMYEPGGNPVWYVADGIMSSPSDFEGPLLQFANGQTLAGAYRAPGTPAAAGTFKVEFSAEDQATITVSDETPQKLFKSFPITPLYDRPNFIKPPEYWNGIFDYKINTPTAGWTLNGSDVQWYQNVVSLPPGAYPGHYGVLGAKVDITLEVVTQPPPGLPSCSVRGKKTVNLTDANSAGSTLTLNADKSTYSGTILVKVAQFKYTHTCDTPNFPVTEGFYEDLEFSVPISGTLKNNEMRDRLDLGADIVSKWLFFPHNRPQ